MNNIVFYSGDNLRHKYIADKLLSKKYNFYWVITKRKKKISFKKKISKRDQKFLDIHNRKRILAEKKFFNNSGKSAFKYSKKKIYIKENSDSNKIIINFVKKIKPKIFITYGCKKIDIEKIKKRIKFRCYFWNIHAGFSPWYRGTITHFWPSYMLEPEKTIMTMHEITNDIDWGPVIDQTGTKLKKNDNLHELSCRAVYTFGKSLKKKIEFSCRTKKKLIGIPHKSHGQIWTNKMWEPKHLNLIYKTFKDKIVEYCIKNKTIKKINLKSIF